MRWLGHRWSQWQDGSATFARRGGDEDTVIQFRRCAKCNKLQIRNVLAI